MGFKVDFVGIGAPKCGTTKIARLLAGHPEICLSEPKEIQYFNERATYLEETPNPKRMRDMDWYSNHFNHCSIESVKGEFATVYMYCPDAARLIYEAFPHAKIIAAIRQPAERAFSHYLMLRYFQKREQRSFEEVVKKEVEFIDKGKYAQQLRPYFELFGADQIMVVDIDDLHSDVEQVAAELYRFLGVDDDFVPDDLSDKVNTAKAMRFRWLSILYGTLMEKMIDWGFSGVIRSLRKTGIKKIYDRLNHKENAAMPQMSEAMHKSITKACLEDIEELEDLLGKDFSKWKNF